MKKIFCLLALVTVSLALMASQQQGEEEKMSVKVKSSETVTGVVIVHVQKGGDPSICSAMKELSVALRSQRETI